MKFEELVEKIVKKDEDGKMYVIKSDIDALKLFESQRLRLELLLKNANIKIRDYIIEKDRSPLVRDYDYGVEAAYEKQHLDKPRFAKFTFSDSGELISADYKELDDFLESFIPSNVVMKRKRDETRGEITLYPSIQLNAITKLRLSELEQKHVMEYLENNGIMVCGYSESLESEFDNYDYYRTYRTQVLPRPLTEEEVEEKFNLLRLTKDPVIREQLILHNMRLVPYIAWKIADFYGLSMHELESYGYEGLIEAVDRFDVTLGYSFSTYAYTYIDGFIKSGCQLMLTNERNAFAASYIQVKKIVEDENATTLEESPELIDDVVDLLIARGDIGIRNRETVKNRINLLNATYLTDVEDTLTIDESEILSIIDFNTLKDRLANVLDTLTPKEEQVLKLRFGLLDGRPRTLEEVGKVFGVSRERIRNIEAKALRKLRHPYRSKQIKEFLYDELSPQNSIKKF